MVEKIILGDWDGEPIWRYKTAAEMLSDEVDKVFAENTK